MPTPSWWVKTTELTTDRGGVGRNALGPLEATRKFRVIVRDKRVAQLLVCGAPGIPYLWSHYTSYDGGEFFTLLPCIRIEAVQEDHGEGEFFSWIVTCLYSNDLGNVDAFPAGTNNPDDPNSPQNNPEFEPPEIEWGGETMARALPVDLDGVPYTNSALKPFKPAPQIEYGYRTLTYSRNELFHSIVQAQEYSYALNDDVFFGYPRGQVQCMPPTARAVFKVRYYYRVTYKFRFFPTFPKVRVRKMKFPAVFPAETIDWQPHILDAGQMMKIPHPLIPATFLQMPIKRGLQNVSEDVPLNGQGLPQAPDVGGTTITPTFIKFQSYPYRTFAALMIRA